MSFDAPVAGTPVTVSPARLEESAPLGRTQHDSWARTRFELPACCDTNRLHLPAQRPKFAVRNYGTADNHWELGMSTWHIPIGVMWWEFDHVRSTLADHVHHPVDEAEAFTLLHQHGVPATSDGDFAEAWVGEQVAHVFVIDDPWAEPANRPTISTGNDLHSVADDAEADLEDVVGAIAGYGEDGDGSLFTREVLDLFPVAEYANRLLVLSSVNVTPALRGNGLGGWGAAQAIAALAPPGTLVVTHAAPLGWGDIIPDVDSRTERTPEERALRAAEQKRLAAHWRTTLGFTPLQSNPNVLIWHTDYENDALRALHARYPV